jgi:hypothetical protein
MLKHFKRWLVLETKECMRAFFWNYHSISIGLTGLTARTLDSLLKSINVHDTWNLHKANLSIFRLISIRILSLFPADFCWSSRWICLRLTGCWELKVRWMKLQSEYIFGNRHLIEQIANYHSGAWMHFLLICRCKEGYHFPVLREGKHYIGPSSRVKFDINNLSPPSIYHA